MIEMLERAGGVRFERIADDRSRLRLRGDVGARWRRRSRTVPGAQLDGRGDDRRGAQFRERHVSRALQSLPIWSSKMARSSGIRGEDTTGAHEFRATADDRRRRHAQRGRADRVGAYRRVQARRRAMRTRLLLRLLRRRLRAKTSATKSSRSSSRHRAPATSSVDARTGSPSRRPRSTRPRCRPFAPTSDPICAAT